MVNKVKEILDATGDRWYTASADVQTQYLPYEEVLMSADDKLLSAARFNSLRFNIGAREVTTGIGDRSPGDIVYGNYFVILANCINEWIGKL